MSDNNAPTEGDLEDLTLDELYQLAEAEQNDSGTRDSYSEPAPVD